MLGFVIQYLKNNIASAMEYRVSFIMQSVGMFLNDFAWIILWFLIFLNANNIKGWYYQDMLLLMSIITASYGLNAFIFGNWNRISEIIIRGELDFYMALPKPPLLHILISRANFSGLGDFAFGMVLLPFTGIDLSKLPLYLLLMVLVQIISLCFMIIINSSTFFIGGTGKLQELMGWGVFTFSTYPFDIYEGAIKILLFTALPIGFMSGLPVTLLKGFSWINLGYMFAFTIFIFIAANAIFNIGLKRYESGNLIVARL